MALTVGELNVQLEASTKEFQERLDEVDAALDKTARTTGEATERTRASFLNFGTAIAAANVALQAASVAGVRFGGTLLRIATLIPGVRLAAIALGAALALLGLRKFANAGIELAASFEQVEVALGTLTGSAQVAQEVLREVNKIVLETPFSLQELANVSRQLAIVFGSNAEQIAEFTRVTADIAAVSGKSVEQIGSQIQRAVVSGLASAEVLRESGITALLLEQAGVTDAAALSGENLLQAFRDLTAEGGKAFGAAARQAVTLTGALSNAQIASDEFKRAFGVALSPTTIARAKNTQESFVALKEVIEDLTPLIQAVATIFSSIFNAAVDVAVGTVRLLITPLKALESGLAAIQVIIVAAAFAIESAAKGAFSLIRVAVALLTGDFETASTVWRDFTKSVTDSPVLILLTNTFNTAADAAEDFLNSVRGFLRAVPPLAALAEALGFATEETESFAKKQREAADAEEEVTKRTEAETKALKDLQKVGAAFRAVTIQDRVDALDEEIRRVSQLQVAEQDRELQGRRLMELAAERTRLTRTAAEAEAALPSLMAAVREEIAAIGAVDPRAARTLGRQLLEGVEAAGPDIIKQFESVEDVALALSDRRQDNELKLAADLAREKERLEKAADTERKRAAAALVDLTAGANLARLEGLDREIEVTNRRIVQAEELAKLAEDEVAAIEAVTVLQEHLAELQAERTKQVQATAAAQAALPEALAGVEAQIGKLGELDEEKAARFTRDLQKALAAAGDDPEALLKVATGFGERLGDVLTDLRVPGFAEKIGDDVASSMLGALTGEGDFGFGQTLADSMLEFGKPALDEMFSEAVEGFGDLFEGAIQAGAGFLEGLNLGGGEGGGIFGGLGEFFQGAAGKATVGLLGAGLQAALTDDKTTRSVASGVSSAVTSAQAVRGIVAGPTQIAVAQVDRAISDAFVETNLILARIEENTRRTAQDAAPSGGGSIQTGGSSAATEALANESPTLV